MLNVNQISMTLSGKIIRKQIYKQNRYLKKVSFVIFAFLTITIVQAQPDIIDQTSFGGAFNDLAYSFQPTNDNGYVLASTSNSKDGDVSGNHGGYDFWVVKLSALKTIQWQKSLGGSSDDEIRSIQQTTDGGFILAGFTYSNDGDVSGNHGSGDCWVVKLDMFGGIEWEKTLGGSNFDEARSVQQTSDGGFIVAGTSSSNNGDLTNNYGDFDCWIVKLSGTGSIQWQKTLGGSKVDKASVVKLTSDGGFIIAGFTESSDEDVTFLHGGSDMWIVKLNENGQMQWQKTFGGSNSEEVVSMIPTNDGNYIAAGYTQSEDGDVSGFHGNVDIWVVKFSDFGAILWEKSLGGTSQDVVGDIRQSNDGGYIVAGSSSSNDGDISSNQGQYDCWIVQLSNIGNIQWQKSLGGMYDDLANTILQIDDGSFILAGTTASNDGDVSGNHGSFDSWIVTLNAVSTGNVDLPFYSNEEYSLKVSPNPAYSHIYLTIEPDQSLTTVRIIDVMGRTSLVRDVIPYQHIDISDLHNGLYWLFAYNTSGKSYVCKFRKQE